MTKDYELDIFAKSTISVYPMGLAGIEIKDIIYDIENYVEYTTPDNKAHSTKIYYGERPYFKWGNMRVYFDECMGV